MLAAMRQTHGAEQPSGALSGLIGGTAADGQRQRYILFRRQGIEKLKRLEHEADLSPPQQGALVFVHLSQIDSADADAARCRLIQAGEQMQQRTFAGAGRSHDGDELATAERQIDAAQRLDARRRRAVSLRQSSDHEDGVIHNVSN